MESKREELLIHMYDQMFNDINRHIMVIWQSVGTLVGTFALFALVEKKVIGLDLTVALIVLASAWLLAHLFDASYWYNRNLAIIANIERQFLTAKDQHDIHYYFGAHRPNNKMITHLRIQFALGVGLVILVIGYHFMERVATGFGLPFSAFEPSRALPYVVLCAAGVYLVWLRRNRGESYAEFLRNSPGIRVASEGIEYGVGHGHGRSKLS